MNRIRVILLLLCAVCGLSAQNTSPSAQYLLEQEWKGGSWRTIQQAMESSDGSIRATIAIERPSKARIEMKIRIGSDSGSKLTAIVDGDSTWILNSRKKQYAKLQSAWPIPKLLPIMSGTMVQQLVGRSGVFSPSTSLTEALSTTAPLGRSALMLPKAETIKVGHEKMSCWVVRENGVDAWIGWIDKNLSFPLKIGIMEERWSYVEPEDSDLYKSVRLEPEFVGMVTTSLKIDEPILPSTFAFTPPKGFAEISVPLRQPSTLLAAAADREPVPNARQLALQDWSGGNWRTIQFETEVSRNYNGLGIGNSITTKVAIEKPGRMRVDLKSLDRTVSAISDGVSTWIYSSNKKQYAKLSGPGLPSLLSQLDEIALRQLLGANNIRGQNTDYFSDLATIRSPILAANLWDKPAVAEGRTMELGNGRHNCWTVETHVRDLGPFWNSRQTCIDTDLWIPIQFAAIRKPFLNSDPNNTMLLEDELFESTITSLKIDEPIPASVFVLAAPKGYLEVSVIPSRK